MSSRHARQTLGHTPKWLTLDQMIKGAATLLITFTLVSTTTAQSPVQPTPSGGLKVSGKKTSAAFRPIQQTSQQTLPQTSQPFPNQRSTPEQKSVGEVDRNGHPVGTVRQTAFMQTGGYGPPPQTGAPSTAAPAIKTAAPSLAEQIRKNQESGGVIESVRGQNSAAPGLSLPPELQSVPTDPQYNTQGQLQRTPPSMLASPSDASPVTQPQLQQQWSTTDNCVLVSPPSGYAASFWGCGPTVTPVSTYPYSVVPATMMPNAPGAVAVTNMPVGYRPLLSLGQENYNVQLGRGIVGQPVAYVPGQHVRNFLRYLFP